MKPLKDGVNGMDMNIAMAFGKELRVNSSGVVSSGKKSRSRLRSNPYKYALYPAFIK